MTNREALRKGTDEQLGEFLADLIGLGCEACPVEIECDHFVRTRCGCIGRLTAWLKRDVKEAKEP